MSRINTLVLTLVLCLGVTAGFMGCDEDAAPPPVITSELSPVNDATAPDAAPSSDGAITPEPPAEESAPPPQPSTEGVVAAVAIFPVDWKLEEGLLAKQGAVGSTTLWLSSPTTKQFAHVAIQGSSAKPSFSCNGVQTKMNTISEYAQSFCKEPDKTCWTLMVSFDASAFTSSSYTCTVGVEGASVEFQVKKKTVSIPIPDATTDGIQLEPPHEGVKIPTFHPSNL